MKNIMNVYMSEFFCVSDLVHDFDDERYRILILDDHPIEHSIIYTEM